VPGGTSSEIAVSAGTTSGRVADLVIGDEMPLPVTETVMV